MRTSFFIALVTSLLVVQTSCNREKKQTKAPAHITPPPNMAYGYNLNDYQVFEDTVQPDWTLSHLFLPYNVFTNTN